MHVYGGRLTLAVGLVGAMLLAPWQPQAEAAPVFNLQQIASGLNKPLWVGNADDGTNRLFILEQIGNVRLMNAGVLDPVPYLNLQSKVSCCGERGLLGLAFHPDFASNGLLYVSYTRAGDGASVIERYTASPPSAKPSLATGVVLLVQSQPFANHNGGNIAFGPDGYLYIGLGDGGSAGDPQNNGQNLATLLGKMLRIDVGVPTGYAIPADNPFVGVPGARAEIWAYGLRNPWRWSFDRATGDLWIGDVGQNLIEEVDYQPASSDGGENYGWRAWEGHFPYTPLQVPGTANATFPVFEYAHNLHCSITGGYVYRGAAVPALVGLYLFSDYCAGTIWGGRASEAASGVMLATPLHQTALDQIVGFGEDESGELYVAALQGRVYKIVP